MKNSTVPAFVIAAFMALFMALAALPAGAANLVVVASTAPGLAPGQIVHSGDPLEVPNGARVTLISETGNTVTVPGPHSGPAEIAAGPGGSDGLLVSLSGLLSGPGRETASLGTMRAAAPRATPGDPWVINVNSPGHHCVPEKGPVMFWRAKATGQKTLLLKNLVNRTRSATPWPAGTETLNWPAQIEIKQGTRYLARMKGGRTSAWLIMHLVPDGLPTDAHRAAWMAEKGCLKQAKLLLAHLR